MEDAARTRAIRLGTAILAAVVLASGLAIFRARRAPDAPPIVAPPPAAAVALPAPLVAEVERDAPPPAPPPVAAPPAGEDPDAEEPVRPAMVENLRRHPYWNDVPARAAFRGGGVVLHLGPPRDGEDAEAASALAAVAEVDAAVLAILAAAGVAASPLEAVPGRRIAIVVAPEGLALASLERAEGPWAGDVLAMRRDTALVVRPGFLGTTRFRQAVANLALDLRRAADDAGGNASGLEPADGTRSMLWLTAGLAARAADAGGVGAVAEAAGRLRDGRKWTVRELIDATPATVDALAAIRSRDGDGTETDLRNRAIANSILLVHHLLDGDGGRRREPFLALVNAEFDLPGGAGWTQITGAFLPGRRVRRDDGEFGDLCREWDAALDALVASHAPPRGR